MKFLILFVTLAASSLALPAPEQKVSVSQDTAGNYRFLVNTNGASRAEEAHADGTVSGSYSFLDSNGVLQTVQYTAGPDGFRATGTNLPVGPIDSGIPVRDTPEVEMARAVHLAALARAREASP